MLLVLHLSRFKREKDMKSHSVRLSPPRPSSSLARLTSNTSGNDRPGLARRQSRSRSQESFEEVGESPSPTPSPPLNATISWRSSPLARHDCGSIISVGAAARRGRAIGWPQPITADGFRSLGRRLCAVPRLALNWRGGGCDEWRAEGRGGQGRGRGVAGGGGPEGSGAVGRASGGNLPLDTSYSGEVQSLVDLEAWWYSASDEFTVTAARLAVRQHKFQRSGARRRIVSSVAWCGRPAQPWQTQRFNHLQSRVRVSSFLFFSFFPRTRNRVVFSPSIFVVACTRQEGVQCCIRIQRRERGVTRLMQDRREIYALQWYKCATHRVLMTERDCSVFLWYVIQMCARAHHRSGT